MSRAKRFIDELSMQQTLDISVKRAMQLLQDSEKQSGTIDKNILNSIEKSIKTLKKRVK